MPSVDFNRVAKLAVLPQLEAMRGQYRLSTWAVDGVVETELVPLGRGRPLLKWKPKEGSVSVPGQTVKPSEAMPQLPGARVEMGVGFAVGFLEVWDAAAEERQRLYAAATESDEGTLLKTLLDLTGIVQACFERADARINDKADDKKLPQAEKGRTQIHAYSRR